ncbi:hypothetical protein RSC2_01810 [Bacillus paralicheniformis]|nr:hypothetical protein RSC1_04351 [Bacillus paralicheniformis]BCE10014.1 hypothetical protein RSC2_01810 [Bacillus paralicheniformis]BCE16202.1 hypothetical protein RSC3_03558 [Bacillus paralicheniformis]
MTFWFGGTLSDLCGFVFPKNTKEPPLLTLFKKWLTNYFTISYDKVVLNH